jgi:hypothetical protein
MMMFLVVLGIARRLGCSPIRIGLWLSAFPWNAFIDILGLGDTDANSDSMRIGSCAQFFGAGQLLKLRIRGRERMAIRRRALQVFGSKN